MDVAIGSIITNVDELLTHMLMKAGTALKPRMRVAGRVPTTPRTAMAMRRCSPQLSKAMAMRKPPRKR